MLTISAWQTLTNTCANGVDPDKMAPDQLSRQDLHCRSTYDFRNCYFMFKLKDGGVHFRNARMNRLIRCIQLGNA